MPPGHAMHTVFWLAGWYFPAGQLVHELALSPLNLPLGHVSHSVFTVVGVYFPPGQLVHACRTEYLPAGHTVTH